MQWEELMCQYYKQFQEICCKTYNCIRRHSNTFAIMLSMLYKLQPTIENNKYKQKDIEKFITKRFIPNENYEEAKLKFNTKVEKCHKSQYSSSFIDFFHKTKNDIIFKTKKTINSKLKRKQNLSVNDSNISDKNNLKVLLLLVLVFIIIFSILVNKYFFIRLIYNVWFFQFI